LYWKRCLSLSPFLCKVLFLYFWTINCNFKISNNILYCLCFQPLTFIDLFLHSNKRFWLSNTICHLIRFFQLFIKLYYVNKPKKVGRHGVKRKIIKNRCKEGKLSSNIWQRKDKISHRTSMYSYLLKYSRWSGTESTWGGIRDSCSRFYLDGLRYRTLEVDESWMEARRIKRSRRYNIELPIPP